MWAGLRGDIFSNVFYGTSSTMLPCDGTCIYLVPSIPIGLQPLHALRLL